MRFLHLSDLHLGKRLNEFSLFEDQKYILEQILRLTEEVKPEAVLLSGDIYDKSLPSAEAVELFDGFLTALASGGRCVFVISGNHDSAERIAFGSRLMQNSRVYLSPVYQGKLLTVTLEDARGPVDITLLPFVKPGTVRPFFPDTDIPDYETAVRRALQGYPLHPERRNVLLAHQFVTGAALSESEEISLGGMENVSREALAGFDYVALGHIHGPQNVGEGIRYCGSPLQYSFSERANKSLTLAELGEKGSVKLELLPLKPLREMRELKGSYMELTRLSAYEGTAREDYLKIVLTDEQDVPEALARLRSIYPNLMRLEYDNARTRSEACLPDSIPKALPEPELFGEFYEKQNGQPMNEEQKKIVEALFAGLKEAE